MTKATVPRVSLKGMQRDFRRAAYRVKVPSKAQANVSSTGDSLFTGSSLKGFIAHNAFGGLYDRLAVLTVLRHLESPLAQKDAAVFFLDHFFERNQSGESWIYTTTGMVKLLRCFQGVVNDKQFAEIYERLMISCVAAIAASKHGYHMRGLYGYWLYLTFKQWVRRPDRLFAIRRVPRADRTGRSYKVNSLPDMERGMYRYNLGSRSSINRPQAWIASPGQDATMNWLLDAVRKSTFSLS